MEGNIPEDIQHFNSAFDSPTVINSNISKKFPLLPSVLTFGGAAIFAFSIIFGILAALLLLKFLPGTLAILLGVVLAFVMGKTALKFGFEDKLNAKMKSILFTVNKKTLISGGSISNNSLKKEIKNWKQFIKEN